MKVEREERLERLQHEIRTAPERCEWLSFFLAEQLAARDSVLRASAGDSESHLHYQRRRVAEYVSAQGDQSPGLVPKRRGGAEVALSRAAEYRQEMDHAGPELEGRA